ncbi:MAG: Cache 3/Cache 2 fusion domain-containing protein [candidate division Zixibacteria bacterium]|nr:Cache 3/Cache 2 fusion domain-containing protein [candidate division Zixibacteria bacterium]
MKIALKLTHKIMLMIFAVLVVSITGVAIISIMQSDRYLTDSAKTDLAHLTSMALEMCQVNAEERLSKIKSDIVAAREMFDKIGGNSVTIRDNEMVLNSNGTNYVINNDTKFVDMVKNKLGAACTIFLKQGNTAQRVSTSVINEKGERAVGTYISQPVYDAVIRSGENYIGRAWVVDAWYVTYYQPIKDVKGEIVGSFFVGVPERSATLREGLLSQKVGETGYIYTINTQGVLQIHPAKEGSDLSMHDFIKEMIAKAPNLTNGEIGWIQYPWINKELGETEARDKIVAYTYFKEWDWIIATGSYLEEFTSPVNNIRNAIVTLGLVCLFISLALGFFISRSITRPIIKLVDIAEDVAIGDVSRTVEIRTKDEVGVLAHSFNSVITYLQEAARVAERMAKSDLTVKIEPKSDKDVFGQSFKMMIINLSQMIRNLKASSRELASAASEIATSSEQMSRGANDQTEQVNQVSTAIEEMTATILESSKNANEATDASKNASSRATDGGQIVAETIQGMQKITKTVRESADSIAKLAKSADQIGEIIGVIDEIADQTNLLALNAAIEAARAGEQGRGFAVVADEVRKLAERTGKATGEITEMIKGIQKQTEEAVHSMEAGIQEVDRGRELTDKAGNSLNEIVAMTESVMNMIQQIATASEEQSTAAEQISKNVEHITSVTRETAKGAEQSATAAEELNRQAESLDEMVAKFKVDETA